MPDKDTLVRARRDKKAGKAPSTQAGEFVREEIDHIREGKHGARSSKQAIAIGLSKARRAGVALKPPKAGTTSDKVRRSAARDYARGQNSEHPVNQARAEAAVNALRKESQAAVSHRALAAHAKKAAAHRSGAQRSESAVKGGATKGAVGRASAARRGASHRRGAP